MTITESMCGTCKWWREPMYTDVDTTRRCHRRSPTRIDPHYTIAKDHEMSWDDFIKKFPDTDLNRHWPITRNTDSCGDWELSK